ncbi:nitrate reductase molybdenum cofactor assembly chaperone [Propioniciclava sinopodophylli]|uniref:Nitrate reductase molybdenum cofactor assembly chaperone n=2 Tax=Propioniciclava sinopodophylli TaxID=1837344 RepID=A0A4Q9KGE1_9ACTN|nr:nitrate reductase molybdenum cofactor assembly chaperone [Propioniciclava sinopodophylli]
MPVRRRHPAPSLPEPALRTGWQLVSLLLSYPDDRLLGLLPTIREAAGTLPDAVGSPLLRLAGHLADADPQAVCTAYVDTFDTTRKCALHLTYYAHGDTRKRGIALVQFKQAYRRAGLEVGEDELPDHLSVVLEFGATGSVAVAWKLLNDHRSGIELLQLGLDAKDSPWADAVSALRATLPPLDGSQAEAVARLLAEGPPNEDVGLDGYALDPRLNPHPADDDLDLSLDLTGAPR